MNWRTSKRLIVNIGGPTNGSHMTMILERHRRGMVGNEGLPNTKQEFLWPGLRSLSVFQSYTSVRDRIAVRPVCWNRIEARR